jgi:glycosyltransferase involved in cell wall biosynthesis
MSIILVTEEAIPPVYRFSLTESLAKELARRGIDVYLVCRRGDGEFRHAGIHYEPVDIKGWSLFDLRKRAEANLRLLFKVIRLLRTKDIKLVYGWWPILFFARISGSPVVADMPEFIDIMYRSFNKPLSTFVSPFLRLFQKTVARMSRAVITESDIARAVWASRGIDYSRTYAIPYGVDVDFFISALPDRDFRKRYGIDETQKVIMYHGDIGIDDGVDLLIKATEGIGAKVVVIGDGDPKYMRYLRSLSHPDVIFTGWIPYRMIPGILKTADIYVAPFRSSLYTNSTCPLKIMEALAAGLPLVVSELHAISKYLRNGEDSLFFKPSDTPDLRKKIGLLLSDEIMRKIFSTNSIETARKYFDHKIRINEEADLLIGYL